jgi:hypothetical protein
MSAEDVHGVPESMYTLELLRAAVPELSQRVQELVDVYNGLPAEECSLGEFVLPMGDFLEDGLLLEVLLALLRPTNITSATMDALFGLSIVGQSRRLNTRIRINTGRFKAISLVEQDYKQALIYLKSKQAHGTHGSVVATDDDQHSKPFVIMDHFPSAMKLGRVKEYAANINAEYRRCLEENRSLAERVEDLEAQLIDHSK